MTDLCTTPIVEEGITRPGDKNYQLLKTVKATANQCFYRDISFSGSSSFSVQIEVRQTTF